MVSRFLTVPFLVTLSPTKPQVTPSGLRKSFCGSVITIAVVLSTINPGSGSCAYILIWQIFLIPLLILLDYSFSSFYILIFNSSVHSDGYDS